jgi:hypothetical protein
LAEKKSDADHGGQIFEDDIFGTPAEALAGLEAKLIRWSEEEANENA